MKVNVLPLVSVIIPTYSRPDNIVRAINSVLAQTYQNIEIIVVDDNGRGTPYQIETEKVLKKDIDQGRITYLKHEANKNGSAARNTGFWASKGKFVTFLDDDDEMKPEKIEKQVQAIETSSNPRIAMAYCECLMEKNGKVYNKKKSNGSGNFGKAMLLGKWGLGSGSNLLIKREAVEKIEGYDESFVRHQDTEFTIRLFRHFDVVEVADPLLIKHNDSVPKRPKAKKYLPIEELFLMKFKKDIAMMNPNEANRVYYNAYMRLAILAVNEPDWRFVWKMMKKASIYHRISIRDCMRLGWNFVKKPYKR